MAKISNTYSKVTKHEIGAMQHAFLTDDIQFVRDNFKSFEYYDNNKFSRYKNHKLASFALKHVSPNVLDFMIENKESINLNSFSNFYENVKSNYYIKFIEFINTKDDEYLNLLFKCDYKKILHYLSHKYIDKGKFDCLELIKSVVDVNRYDIDSLYQDLLYRYQNSEGKSIKQWIRNTKLDIVINNL